MSDGDLISERHGGGGDSDGGGVSHVMCKSTLASAGDEINTHLPCLERCAQDQSYSSKVIFYIILRYLLTSDFACSSNAEERCRPSAPYGDGRHLEGANHSCMADKSVEWMLEESL